MFTITKPGQWIHITFLQSVSVRFVNELWLLYMNLGNACYHFIFSASFLKSNFKFVILSY